MFGNRLGWGASVIILILAGGFLWMIQWLGNRMSPPTAIGLNAATYTMTLPIDPRKLAEDFWMKDDGDATDLYKQLDDLYEANHKPFGNFDNEPSLKNPYLKTIQEGADLLIKAGKLKGGSVFEKTPKELVTYDTDRPRLERIATLQQIFLKLALLEKNAGHLDRTRDIYEGLFSMGVRMYEERLVFEEWYRARNLMSVSQYLAELIGSKSPADGQRFAAFDEQILPFYKSRIEPVQKTLQVVYPYPGDAAALAQNAGDRMWRVEAIFALGRVKFTAESGPDQNGAIRLLQQLATDPDPVIKLAATQARDLTVEEFRKLR